MTPPGPGTLHLAAVQTQLDPAAYRSAHAFGEWVLEQARLAVANRDPDEPAVIAFPELIGLGLLLGLDRDDHAATTRDAALTFAREQWRAALPLAARHAAFSAAALTLPRAAAAYTAYRDAFRRAARDTRAVVVAGTAFLPRVDEEAALGVHLVDGRVRNVAFTFDRSGHVLARTEKVNLTAGLERGLGLTRGRLEHVIAARTSAGRVATLVCYDAFFERAVERVDALGASVLVQPSANARAWHGPWSADATLDEGDTWWRRGPAARVQDRTNLRYVVNPMLTGRLYDLEFQGRSSIAVNRALEPRVPVDEYGLTAVATVPDAFEIVSARVPAPPA